MRAFRTTFPLLIALFFIAAPARNASAGPQKDAVCQGSCGGGCGPCPSYGGSNSYSSGNGMSWGHMTSRNLARAQSECGDKPLCVIFQSLLGVAAGAVTDVPYYAVKGVGYGVYYGGMGIGKGLFYTGRAIGRGLAYPFNRPPKPIVPPTTWEQYKHDVLRYQKISTKANKANMENQRWCESRVPLAASANRAEWESRCNPGEAISRAALPAIIFATTIASAAPATTAATSSPSATPAVAAAPIVNPPSVAPTVPNLPAVGPALQDPAVAIGAGDAQAKTAGANGFDNAGPMVGKLSASPATPAATTADGPTQAAPTAMADRAIAMVPSALATDTVESKRPPEGQAAPESTPPSAPMATLSSPVTPAPATPASSVPATLPIAKPAVGVSATSTTSIAGAAASVTTTTASGVSFTLPVFVQIEGDKEFKRKTARDLEILSNTATGKALLKSMSDSGRKLKFVFDGDLGNETESDPLSWSAAARAKKPLPGAGTKTNVTIKYNPDRTNVLFLGTPYSDKDVTWTREPNRPSHIGMFHEMVHADDMMHGTIDISIQKNVGKRAGDAISAFELRAVGLDGKKHEFDENGYRRELNLPERDFY